MIEASPVVALTLVHHLAQTCDGDAARVKVFQQLGEVFTRRVLHIESSVGRGVGPHTVAQCGGPHPGVVSAATQSARILLHVPTLYVPVDDGKVLVHAGRELGPHVNEVDHVQPDPHVDKGVIGHGGIGRLIKQGGVDVCPLFWEDVDVSYAVEAEQNHHHTHLGKGYPNNEDGPEGWQSGKLIAD